jgi:chaperonin cofactor prefoldin
MKNVSQRSGSVYGGQLEPTHFSQIVNNLEKLEERSKTLKTDLKIQQERLNELTSHAISTTSNRI